MQQQNQPVFNNPRIHPHLFPAVVFQPVAVCIHSETDCAVFVSLVFWRTHAGIAFIFCEQQQQQLVRYIT